VPVREEYGFAFGGTEREAAALTAVTMLEQVAAGTADVVAELAELLVARPTVGAALDVLYDRDEALIAAAHGVGHLALAVVTAAAVLRSLDLPLPQPFTADGEATVAGVAWAWPRSCYRRPGRRRAIRPRCWHSCERTT
jgi:hypothetical protein